MVTTAPITTTTTGKLEGREKEGVLLFAGIPYAKPPVGELRFRDAQPAEPWDGVRDATKFSPAAPQLPGAGLTNRVPVRWDEDCLYLNVTTPALDSAKRPVMVWIHGGAFRNGQGAIPWYNGTRFAANGDIVVVSINYRLGALGFTHLARFGDEYKSSGIQGINDQILALQWVRDNIENFGGDPDNVTIAGESAGAFSVGTLIASPKAAGLFNKAVAESGAAHHAMPPEVADQATDIFLETLGVTTMEELQAVPADRILEAQDAASQEFAKKPDAVGRGIGAFFPIIDGGVLQKRPIEHVREGASKDVRLLIGSNKDETSLWGVPGDINDEAITALTERVGLTSEVIGAYRANRPDATARDIYIALTSDYTFRIPAIRLVEAREDIGALNWMYYFTWESRAFNGKLGSTHALEIPFAFNNLDRAGVDVFLGEGPKPQHVADAMHAAWTAFIRTGDPSTADLPWPEYVQGQRTTMEFGDHTGLIDDPNSAEREAWHGRRQ